MCPHRKGFQFELFDSTATSLLPIETPCDGEVQLCLSKDTEGEVLYATQSTPEILSVDGEEGDLRISLSASAFSSSSTNLSDAECPDCRKTASKRKGFRSSKLEVDWNPDIFIRTVDDSDGESDCSGGGISWEPRGTQRTKKWTRNEDPELSHPYMHTPYTAKQHVDAQLARCTTPKETESEQTPAAALSTNLSALFPPGPFVTGTPYLPMPIFHPFIPFAPMHWHIPPPCFAPNKYGELRDEMKVELANRVVEYMSGTDTNPEGKPLASEKVQNIIKANNLTLYETVVDRHYGSSWHRFLQDPIFEDKLTLCSIDVNRWFIRLAHDEDWQDALQERKMERSSRDGRIRAALAAYIKKQPNGSCTAEEFLTYLLCADQDPSISLLFGNELETFPRRGQFVRFVKRNSKWFTYDPSSFAIRINERTGAWDRLP